MITTSTTPNPAAAQQRYSTAELEQFRAILQERMADTDSSIAHLEQSLLLDRGNGTDDTYRGSNLVDDGQATLEREEAAYLMARQRKYRSELESALVRVAQGTYGICRVTGKKIPAERLRAVPTATMSIEAKLNN